MFLNTAALASSQQSSFLFFAHLHYCLYSERILQLPSVIGSLYTEVIST
jgi:hypothetical protein